jgi:hypothetical protein
MQRSTRHPRLRDQRGRPRCHGELLGSGTCVRIKVWGGVGAPSTDLRLALRSLLPLLLLLWGRHSRCAAISIVGAVTGGVSRPELGCQGCSCSIPARRHAHRPLTLDESQCGSPGRRVATCPGVELVQDHRNVAVHGADRPHQRPRVERRRCCEHVTRVRALRQRGRVLVRQVACQDALQAVRTGSRPGSSTRSAGRPARTPPPGAGRRVPGPAPPEIRPAG